MELIKPYGYRALGDELTLGAGPWSAGLLGWPNGLSGTVVIIQWLIKDNASPDLFTT